MATGVKIPRLATLAVDNPLNHNAASLRFSLRRVASRFIRSSPGFVVSSLHLPAAGAQGVAAHVASSMRACSATRASALSRITIMTDTPNLGLPFIEGSQAQKHVTHNEALRILDAAIQIAVLDLTRTAPPSSPAEGERHVVASGRPAHGRGRSMRSRPGRTAPGRSWCRGPAGASGRWPTMSCSCSTARIGATSATCR